MESRIADLQRLTILADLWSAPTSRRFLFPRSQAPPGNALPVEAPPLSSEMAKDSSASLTRGGRRPEIPIWNLEIRKTWSTKPTSTRRATRLRPAIQMPSMRYSVILAGRGMRTWTCNTTVPAGTPPPSAAGSAKTPSPSPPAMRICIGMWAMPPSTQPIRVGWKRTKTCARD
ncbi:MAG: hypothetical protein KatS3mg111_1228 [Pirellulaceae bacterium]|nr:MAG: hypothetical protein KatS3mg111_1228 [Pirellulaceae bacterium]